MIMYELQSTMWQNAISNTVQTQYKVESKDAYYTVYAV